MAGYFLPIIDLLIKHHYDDKDGATYGDRKPGPPTHKLPTTQGGDAMDYYFETPCCTPEMIMYPINKRASSPVETPKPKRENRRPRSDERTVVHTGPSYTVDWCRDFSGIQRTLVNPVTGRIIGYKGIPRKRRLSPTSKYSQFWRDQKYAKTSFHAARSPGVWDSARR